MGDYLSHLGALREKAVAFTDPFFQERLDKSQGVLRSCASISSCSQPVLQLGRVFGEEFSLQAG